MMTRVAIVRCARDHYRNLWSAMTLIKLINSVGGMIVVLHVAGQYARLEIQKLLHGNKYYIVASQPVLFLLSFDLEKQLSLTKWQEKYTGIFLLPFGQATKDFPNQRIKEKIHIGCQNTCLLL